MRADTSLIYHQRSLLHNQEPVQGQTLQLKLEEMVRIQSF